MTMDVKNFYLNTPMTWFKYLWLCMGDIPDNVQKHDNLHDKATLMAMSMLKYKKACMVYRRHDD